MKLDYSKTASKYDANMKNEFDIRSEKLMLEEDALERGKVEGYEKGVAEGEARGHAASAAQVWGRSSDYEWILPTADIWQTLLDRCDWVKVDGYNYKGNMVSGMLVTGREDKGETGNSIFLPAGGYYSDEHKDSATYYASLDVTGGKTHIYLWFKDGAVMRSNGSSYEAALVRPVAVPGY